MRHKISDFQDDEVTEEDGGRVYWVSTTTRGL